MERKRQSNRHIQNSYEIEKAETALKKIVIKWIGATK